MDALYDINIHIYLHGESVWVLVKYKQNVLLSVGEDVNDYIYFLRNLVISENDIYRVVSLGWTVT